MGKEIEVNKKRKEAQKEIELNDLKEKACLAQKIITISKNISLI